MGYLEPSWLLWDTHVITVLLLVWHFDVMMKLLVASTSINVWLYGFLVTCMYGASSSASVG